MFLYNFLTKLARESFIIGQIMLVYGISEKWPFINDNVIRAPFPTTPSLKEKFFAFALVVLGYSIGHFTVIDGSEAEGDLVLIQTFLLYYVNQVILMLTSIFQEQFP